MKRFLNKVQTQLDQLSIGGFDGTSTNADSSAPLPVPAPTPKDVARYRYHHGTNLGSVFVLEKWLTGCMFVDGANGSSELAAVEAVVKRDGKDKTRERFEKHWKEYISDSDLDWLAANNCTTVRLPIGYFTLGHAYNDGTPFDKFDDIYKNAWDLAKRLIQRCNDRSIGVLVDLHALPGGANKGDHSGTDSGKAEMWSSKKSRELATRCVCFLVKELRSLDNIAGVQIINEADHDANGMYDWYEDTLKEIAKVDGSIPIYISDAWDLAKCLPWTQSKNTVSSKQNPIVIDTHLYWCFSDADCAKPPQQICDEVPNGLTALNGKDGGVIDRGAAQVVIGEYSCVMGETSWAKCGGTSKDDLVRRFGHTQSQLHQQRTGGSFFWTYRMDWMEGGEWGFKQQTNKKTIEAPNSLRLSAQDVHNRIQQAESQRQNRQSSTFSAHTNYWDAHSPGQQFEHWRFAQGWEVGWNDASSFFGMRTAHDAKAHGGDKIGMLDLWVLKRLQQQSGQTWLYEQGLRQGVRDFYAVANI